MQILKAKGFNDHWIGWVREILSSGSSFVLLNGVLGKQFQCKRGVRQEDPFTPLLFILAADLLQSVVNKMLQDGSIYLPIPSNDHNFPIIQYADDTILLLPADEANCLLSRICCMSPMPQLV